MSAAGAPRWSGRRDGRERGAATLLMAAVAVAGFAVVLGLARFGIAGVAAARAETAADAAALAAADALALGAGPTAARADATATAAADGATLVSCACTGPRVVVDVVVDVPALGRRATARSAAEVRGPVVPRPAAP